MHIGVAITTVPKRAGMHKVQMQHILKYTPPDTFFYVHNDINGIGIAKSKNNCLKALYEAGCKHLFLLDDDVWPISPDWLTPFLISGQHHMCATFDRLKTGATNGNVLKRSTPTYDEFLNPTGIMMYYTRACIERIGGFDHRYGKWGHEHVGLSNRIHNARLTPARFISPKGIMDLIHSEDHLGIFCSTMSWAERTKYADEGRQLNSKEKNSMDWKPFRKADYVLTSFYTKAADDQRQGRTLSPDISQLDTLIDSAPCDVVAFTDIYSPLFPKFKVVSARVPRAVNLYNYRFIAYLEWLKAFEPYCENIYLLDGTDTEFIGEPHDIERGKVYINTEGTRGGLDWLTSKGKSCGITQHLSDRGSDIWNCGVIYGHVSSIITFLEAFTKMLNTSKLADMPALNYLCNTGVPGIEFIPVKSGFKHPDKSGVYIRHK